MKIRLMWTAVCVFALALVIAWLVGCNGNEPAAVTKLPQRPKPAGFGDTYDLDVYPVTDGGAYVHAHKRLWYVRGSEAVQVKEVKSLSVGVPPSKMTPREKVLWTQLQSEITKREAAEAELESVREGGGQE